MVIAIEEDSGADIQASYAMQQAAEKLQLLEISGNPTAMEIAELFDAGAE